MFLVSCGFRQTPFFFRSRAFLPFKLRRTMTEFISSQENELMIDPNQNGIQYAANAISNGELIAFPTETVYGLGANALSEAAVLSIFEAKGRPLTDPLIVHVPDMASALRLISTDSKTESVFQLLGNQFWPGPLTIIVRAAACIPNVITASTGFVGIRVPAHPLALSFLRQSNLPIAAPSANKFGHVSPTRAQHVLDDLGGKGVRVLNGDTAEYQKYTCQHGIESTILKIDTMSSKIFILRQGAISQPEIEDLLQSTGDDRSNWSVEALHRAVNHSTPTTQQPTEEVSQGEVAPGQLLTHYAPYVPCTVINSLEVRSPTLASQVSSQSTSQKPSDQMLELMSRYTKESVHISSQQLLSQTVLIDFNGQFSVFSSLCLAYRDLSAAGNTSEAAKDLFNSLRWAENQTNATRVLLAPICPSLHQQNLSDNSCNADHSSEISDLRSINQKYDPSLGLADRIFRAASGVAVDLVITDQEDKLLEG
jgi:L-threonylcarbamoyladenylate synthase